MNINKSSDFVFRLINDKKKHSFLEKVQLIIEFYDIWLMDGGDSEEFYVFLLNLFDDWSITTKFSSDQFFEVNNVLQTLFSNHVVILSDEECYKMFYNERFISIYVYLVINGLTFFHPKINFNDHLLLKECETIVNSNRPVKISHFTEYVKNHKESIYNSVIKKYNKLSIVIDMLDFVRLALIDERYLLYFDENVWHIKTRENFIKIYQNKLMETL